MEAKVHAKLGQCLVIIDCASVWQNKKLVINIQPEVNIAAWGREKNTTQYAVLCEIAMRTF